MELMIIYCLHFKNIFKNSTLHISMYEYKRTVILMKCIVSTVPRMDTYSVFCMYFTHVNKSMVPCFCGVQRAVWGHAVIQLHMCILSILIYLDLLCFGYRSCSVLDKVKSMFCSLQEHCTLHKGHLDLICSSQDQVM